MEDEDEHTAWPANSPALRTFDLSFRCSVCHDFLDCPMSLNCGHSFCCTCITSNLEFQMKNRSSGKPFCPTCRHDADLQHLRKDLNLQQAVKCFLEVRPHLLRAVMSERKSPSRHGSAPASAPPPRRDRKRPSPGSPDTEEDPREHGSGSKRPRLPRAASASARARQPDPDVCVIDGDHDDDEDGDEGSAQRSDSDSDFENAASYKSRSKRSSAAAAARGDSPQRVPDTKTQCPICFQYFDNNKINRHASTCSVEQKNQANISKVQGKTAAIFQPKKGKGNEPPLKRLGKLAFNLLKGKALPETLKREGVPVSADGKESTKALAPREVLVKRYNDMRVEIEKIINFGNPEGLTRAEVVRMVLRGERNLMNARKADLLHQKHGQGNQATGSGGALAAEAATHEALMRDIKARRQKQKEQHAQEGAAAGGKPSPPGASFAAGGSGGSGDDDDKECQIVEDDAELSGGCDSGSLEVQGQDTSDTCIAERAEGSSRGEWAGAAGPGAVRKPRQEEEAALNKAEELEEKANGCHEEEEEEDGDDVVLVEEAGSGGTEPCVGRAAEVRQESRGGTAEAWCGGPEQRSAAVVEIHEGFDDAAETEEVAETDLEEEEAEVAESPGGGYGGAGGQQPEVVFDSEDEDMGAITL